MDASRRISSYYTTIAVWIERFLALGLLGGVLVFGLRSAQVLAVMDWRLTETFDELIYRVLLLAIGVELVHTLVTHELQAILELLAFVVARKMLKPELAVFDVLLSVLAFVALLAANHFWLSIPLQLPGNVPHTLRCGKTPCMFYVRYRGPFDYTMHPMPAQTR
jgi:hypothetical protein